ncbi:hypothetical protein KL906_003408 [Ogataea polymorpha]|nr:hypothetical protein KL906_003408 [Ogataea polymorpha]
MTEKEIVTVNLTDASEEELVALIAKIADVLEARKNTGSASEKQAEEREKSECRSKQKRKHSNKKKSRKLAREDSPYWGYEEFGPWRFGPPPPPPPHHHPYGNRGFGMYSHHPHHPPPPPPPLPFHHRDVYGYGYGGHWRRPRSRDRAHFIREWHSPPPSPAGFWHHRYSSESPDSGSETEV